MSRCCIQLLPKNAPNVDLKCPGHVAAALRGKLRQDELKSLVHAGMCSERGSEEEEEEEEEHLDFICALQTREKTRLAAFPCVKLVIVTAVLRLDRGSRGGEVFDAAFCGNRATTCGDFWRHLDSFRCPALLLSWGDPQRAAETLLAIAIERYIAITKVKVYGSTKTCRMFLLIGACWVTSILLGGLPIIGWNCINDLPECSAVLPLYAKRYIVFVVTIFSLILLSIVILYVKIYLIVRSSRQEATNSQAYALLKTVTIVLGVFIMCWLPTFIILLLDSSCGIQFCHILSQANIFFGFATLNSALNPVIYTLRI
ncbi:sphingosine 1-phosphate receptor 2 [Solea senegalensis]|uniref:Sphingosine 1-phosphate receptor 2 n=1 Tax=Solea senegalensis TaxID=28829 RepID=A0AAV6RIA5_SOLSE|nr:sphingosine 1-phosphate receptor 2 [Solea senegalensis]